MTSEIEMTEDIADIDNAVDTVSSDPVKAKGDRKGVGLATVMIASGIAALMGMSGGAYFGSMAAKSAQTAPSDFAAEYAATEKSVSALTAKLDRLERELGQLKDTSVNAQNGLPALEDMETRLKQLEDRGETFEDFEAVNKRIETLEKAAFEPETLAGLTDIQSRITSLENSLQSGDLGAEGGLSTVDMTEFTARLDALESDLVARLEVLEKTDLTIAAAVDLSPLTQRLDALQSRINEIPVTFPPFPREDVLKAIEEAKIDDLKGWFGRTFGGQIEIYDADIIARLDRIEENVAARDLKAIQQDVASLPESAKTVLAPWLEQLERLNP